ncbi:MAG TPA: DinB family protein [Chitinophagaceae bacterium]|nr:DinB family protein [Chitinophagaceae bacterium]
MKNRLLTEHYARELEAEYPATRKCLERIPDSLYNFRPHTKSMELGYLSLLVAEIPLWITLTIKEGTIDLATFKSGGLSTTDALVRNFDKNFQSAVEALRQATDDKLEDEFKLMNKGQVLISSSKDESVSSSINHWVHHRGQLTVYMRLNEIPVPSIYGPSADERSF